MSIGMMKRMLLMLTVMAGLIGGLGFVKFQQIQAAIAEIDKRLAAGAK